MRITISHSFDIMRRFSVSPVTLRSFNENLLNNLDSCEGMQQESKLIIISKLITLLTQEMANIPLKSTQHPNLTSISNIIYTEESSNIYFTLPYSTLYLKDNCSFQRFFIFHQEFCLKGGIYHLSFLFLLQNNKVHIQSLIMTTSIIIIATSIVTIATITASPW